MQHEFDYSQGICHENCGSFHNNVIYRLILQNYVNKHQLGNAASLIFNIKKELKIVRKPRINHYDLINRIKCFNTFQNNLISQRMHMFLEVISTNFTS